MNILIWLRSFLAVLVLFPIVTLLSCLFAGLALLLKMPESVVNSVIKIWAKISCWMFGVTIRVYGEENIIKSGALVLFNHRSFFDIFAIYSRFPEFRFGAKVELFSIPIFGATMRAVGTLPIARQNREAAIQVLKDAYAQAQSGRKFALSPEGGRNSGEGLLPFKVGPFVFAIEAGVPVLPVIIRGAEKVWPKGALVPATKSWKSKIEIWFLPALDATKYDLKSRTQLQEATRNSMLSLLESLANSSQDQIS